MARYNTKEHFDEIASGYHEEISIHIRDHLINKWWAIVSPYFKEGDRILDIGCGDGTNALYLKNKGLSVRGIDYSLMLIKQGRQRYPELQGSLVQGSALSLPFDEGSFDNATLIGVLHHIHSVEEQMLAVQEALRVVRDGGHMIIRECNLINPFFRIFWNYVFPLTTKIDRFGGESWIPARKLSRAFPGRVEEVSYFTFLPNFTPGFIFPYAARVESLIEKRVLRKLAAHYVLVLKK